MGEKHINTKMVELGREGGGESNGGVRAAVHPSSAPKASPVKVARRRPGRRACAVVIGPFAAANTTVLLTGSLISIVTAAPGPV